MLCRVVLIIFLIFPIQESFAQDDLEKEVKSAFSVLDALTAEALIAGAGFGVAMYGYSVALGNYHTIFVNVKGSVNMHGDSSVVKKQIQAALYNKNLKPYLYKARGGVVLGLSGVAVFGFGLLTYSGNVQANTMDDYYMTEEGLDVLLSMTVEEKREVLKTQHGLRTKLAAIANGIVKRIEEEDKWNNMTPEERKRYLDDLDEDISYPSTI